MWSSWFIAALVAAAPDVGPSAVSVGWSAPEGCGEAKAVQTEIDRLLEGSTADRSRVSADATVAQGEDGYQLSLQVTQDGTVSTRALQVSTCGEAVEAAALLVAMAVDPSAASNDAAAVPEPVPEPESVPEPEPVPEPKAAPPEPKAAPPEPQPEPPATVEPRLHTKTPRAQGFVRGGAAVGLTPGWGGWLQLGAGVGWKRVELHALVSGWLPRSDASQDISARFQLWTGGVSACPVLRPLERIDIPLCAGLHAGAMIGRGLEGLEDVRSSTEPWFGVSVGPAVRGRVHRWVSVVAGANLFVSLIRPAFDTDQGTLVHRADWVGGSFFAGVSFGRPP